MTSFHGLPFPTLLHYIWYCIRNNIQMTLQDTALTYQLDNQLRFAIIPKSKWVGWDFRQDSDSSVWAVKNTADINGEENNPLGWHPMPKSKNQKKKNREAVTFVL